MNKVFIRSIFSAVLCIYLLRLLWFFLLGIILRNNFSGFLSILEILSPFITYFFIKKYFTNIPKLQEIFVEFRTVKKNTLIIFIIEMILTLLLLILGLGIAEIFYIYLFYFLHISCLLWYLPFLIMSYINEKKKEKI